MLNSLYRQITILTILFCCVEVAAALTDKYRCTWRGNPATSIVIGWNQISGSQPVIHFGTTDGGSNIEYYNRSQRPDRHVSSRGMNNHFARLTGLMPNTLYYFVIQDSEGTSEVLSFKTLPNTPSTRLSIIAGGDSRNHREARQNANQLVGKLSPHAVMFGGDMTASDSPDQWQNWFDDWQLTTTEEGKLTPIIPARGNHEASNQTLVDLFDIPYEGAYYALTFGGNLLRVYTLNSMIASGGNQADWLVRNLSASKHIIWKMAQYHHSMRPHTQRKPEKNDLLHNWAKPFTKYGVNLVVESDIHVVKSTYPIRPSKGPRSHQGFVRDDENGTVYVGEGCWGAPLRANNDNKPWTRSSGSFNQFKLIFVDNQKIEVRTVKTDNARDVAAVSPYNIFNLPVGIKIWNPAEGDVIIIRNRQASAIQAPTYTIQAATLKLALHNLKAERQNDDVYISWNTTNEPDNVKFELERSVSAGNNFTKVYSFDSEKSREGNYSYLDPVIAEGLSGKVLGYRVKFRRPNGEIAYTEVSKLRLPPSGPTISDGGLPKLITHPLTHKIEATYTLQKTSDVTFHLLNENFEELSRLPYPNKVAGTHKKALDLTKASPGTYTLVIKADKRVVQRYRVIRR